MKGKMRKIREYLYLGSITQKREGGNKETTLNAFENTIEKYYFVYFICIYGCICICIHTV